MRQPQISEFFAFICESINIFHQFQQIWQNSFWNYMPNLTFISWFMYYLLFFHGALSILFYFLLLSLGRPWLQLAWLSAFLSWIHVLLFFWLEQMQGIRSLGGLLCAFSKRCRCSALQTTMQPTSPPYPPCPWGNRTSNHCCCQSRHDLAWEIYKSV